MQQRSGYRHPVCANALSDVEQKIIAAYAGGLRRTDIARQVGLADRTVGTYLTTVKEKLGARNLVHAAALCVAGGTSDRRERLP